MRELALALPLWLALSAACDPPQSQADARPGPGADALVLPSIDAAITADALADASTTGNCAGTFVLTGQGGASSAWLTGTFTTTAWAPDLASGAIEMALGGGGNWSVQHTLAPGRHLYKFIIDGVLWVHDSANPETEDDGFGGLNSVFTCGAFFGAPSSL